MKITAIKIQTRDKNRVNIEVDGKYRFSLSVYQLSDLALKVGSDYTSEELDSLEQESTFGKVYARALEYCLMRPHSSKEVRDYLYRKTRDSRTKTGDVKKGIAKQITDRVFDRLVEKKYIDDESFSRYWVENRSLIKGSSMRKLVSELRAKGINSSLIQEVINSSERSDEEEIQKIIVKKRSKYPDDQKLMAYLARLGFSYDDIKSSLEKL